MKAKLAKLLEPKVHHAPPAKLVPDPNQPRKMIDKAGIAELAGSLKAIGMVQPIVVRKIGKKIMIVSGERRWRAAKLAKLKTVPFIYRDDVGQIERAATQIAENVQRESLNPADLARFLLRLRTSENKSTNALVGELAKVGVAEVSHSRVEKLLEINNLPDWAMKHLESGALTEQHAIALLPNLKFPAVLEELKGEVARQLKWTGSVSLKDLERDIAGAYNRAGRVLKTNWGGNGNRRFDLKRCNGCEFKVKQGGTIHCMNPVEFDKKNAEADALQVERDQKKAAKVGKLKGAKGTALSKAEVKKREQRKEQLTEEKLSKYLDGWLRPRILACIASRATGLQVYGLTYWLATGAVDKAQSWTLGQRGETVVSKTRGVLYNAKLGDFPTVLEYAMDAKAKAAREHAIAQAAVSAMTEGQLRWFARAQLQFDLLKEGFRVDLDFLNLHRKSDLIRLAEIGGLEPRGAGGVPQLKRDILDTATCLEKIGVPANLAALYAKAPKLTPASVFKHPEPTDHDELLHSLGLDSAAGVDDIAAALHDQAEKQAETAKAEADKAAKAAAKGKKKVDKKVSKKKAKRAAKTLPTKSMLG